MAGIDLSINFGNTERQSKAVTKALNSFLSSVTGSNKETEDLRITVSKYAKEQPKVQSSTNKTSKSIKDMGNTASKSSKQMKTLSGSSSSLGGSFTSLNAAIGLVAGSALVSFLGKSADTMTMVENRLKLVTDSTEELNSVQKELFKSSQRTFSQLTDTVNLYSRLARSTEEYGYSQNQTLKVTEAINQAFVVSGSSAEEASAAVIQLGQGLASGALRGDELRSVLEQAPRLARALADGLGVSVGELRSLGAEGELTTEKVFGALLEQSQQINEEFNKMSPTLAQAGTNFYNSMIRGIGALDDATDASSTLSKIILGWSALIDYAVDGMSDFSSETESAAKHTERIKKDYEAISGMRLSVSPIVGEGGEIDLAKEFEESEEKAKKLREEIDSMLNAAVDPLSKKVAKINKTYDEMLAKVKGINTPTRSNLDLINKINAARDAEIAKLRQAEELKAKEVEQERVLKAIRDSGFTSDADSYTSRKLKEEKAFTAAIVKLNAEARDKESEAYEKYLKKAKELDGRALKKRKENLKKEYEAVLALSEDKEKVQKEYAKKFKDIEDEIRRNSLSEWERWGEDLTRDVFASVAEEGKDVMSDVLFDGIRGDMDDFSDYWDSAWQGILRTFTDAIAEMATKKIVEPALEFAMEAIFAKDGLWEVAEDGQKVVAHKGEMVLPAEPAEKLRKIVDTSGDFDSINELLSVDPLSVYDGSEYAGNIESALNGKTERSAFAKGAFDSLRGTAKKSISGGAYGLLSGKADFSDVMNATLSPKALGNALLGAVVGGTKASLGYESYISGLGGGVGSLGVLLSGTAMGGPLGMIAMSAGNLLGSALFDGIGDVVDARPFEKMTDSLEDSVFGFFGGKQISAQLQTGNIDLSSFAPDEINAIGTALDAARETNFSAYDPDSFLGSVYSTFNAVSDIFSAPFNALGDFLSDLFGIEPDVTKLGLPLSAIANAVSQKQALANWEAENLGAISGKLGLGTGILSSIAAGNYGPVSFEGVEGRQTSRGGTGVGRAGSGAYGTGLSGSGTGGLGGSISGFGGSNGRSEGTAGGLGGWENGGVIDRVLASTPREDGLIPVQLGEGVVSRAGMENLAAINEGSFSSGMGKAPQVVINIVTDTGQQLKQFVVDTVRDSSERNIATIHANGIYGAA